MVGTSIPSTKQAKPVRSNAGQILFPEADIINEVNLTPKPVIDKIPIIIEAHNIIEPIKAVSYTHLTLPTKRIV